MLLGGAASVATWAVAVGAMAAAPTTPSVAVPTTQSVPVADDTLSKDQQMVEEEMADLPSLGVHDLNWAVDLLAPRGRLVVETQVPVSGLFYSVVLRGLPGATKVQVMSGVRHPTRKNIHFKNFQLSTPGAFLKLLEVYGGPNRVALALSVDRVDGSTLEVQAMQSGSQPLVLYAQLISDLPNEAFNLSVSAANLPEMRIKHAHETDLFFRPLLRSLGAEKLLACFDERQTWQVVGDSWHPDAQLKQQVDAIVARLDADAYEQREAATADLGKIGGPAAVYLESTDRSQLTPEQRVRVDSFIAGYSPLSAQQARGFHDDVNFLLDSLYFPDARLRRLVLDRLSKDHGGAPLAFDLDANGDRLDQEVAALRANLAPDRFDLDVPEAGSKDNPASPSTQVIPINGVMVHPIDGGGPR